MSGSFWSIENETKQHNDEKHPKSIGEPLTIAIEEDCAQDQHGKNTPEPTLPDWPPQSITNIHRGSPVCLRDEYIIKQVSNVGTYWSRWVECGPTS
jgi:hypothetical protein